MGILGNKPADVVAKNAAEGVPPDGHEWWMSGGGIQQWAKQRKRDYLEEGEDAVIGRVMGWRRKAVTNYCQLRGGNGIGRWWEKKIGWTEEEVSEMWGGKGRCANQTTDNGPHSVPLWEGPKSEGRKGKGRLGKGKRDEVG